MKIEYKNEATSHAAVNRSTVLHVIIISLVTTLISGCTTSSGVVPTGQGIYMIARTQKGFRGSSSPVKAAALKEANKYCESRGKVMKVVKTVQKDMKPFKSDAYAEVYFKCLDPDDPELKLPAVIEEIRE